MATTRGRLIAPAQVVYDQADIFQHDGFTRVAGLAPTDLALQVYLNNTLQGWILVDGTATADTQVVVGKVYLSSNSNGPYNIRWRPNAVGYWRLILTYAAGNQILAQDYDVSPSVGTTSGQPGDGGLQASFIRPFGS